jgi:predicted MFS family arabinose efflux permease
MGSRCVAYHFQKGAIATEQTITLLYAMAMGVDAVAALIFGRLFDRAGISILAIALGGSFPAERYANRSIAVFLSLMFAPLVFLGSSNLALLGMILWGIGMGAQESILKAAVAGMVPIDKRASAYGIFSAGYGLSWFLGSALMGILYDQSISLLVVFSVVIQLAAIPILWLVRRH